MFKTIEELENWMKENKITQEELPYTLVNRLVDVPLEDIPEVVQYFEGGATLFTTYLDQFVDFTELDKYYNDAHYRMEFLEYAMCRCPSNDDVIVLRNAIGRYIVEHFDRYELEMPE